MGSQGGQGELEGAQEDPGGRGREELPGCTAAVLSRRDDKERPGAARKS